MVKTVRKIGKKVNFSSTVKNLALDEEASEIKKKFSEIKKAEEALRIIQLNPKKGILGKGKQIKQKQTELKKIINLWTELNQINFDELGREEIINILNSQKKFIEDLLKHYSISIKKEKIYIQKIKGI